MENVLITGGAGYIGSLLTPMLLEQGYRVTIFDSFLFGAMPLLGFSRHPNLEIVKGDIRRPEAVQEAVRGQDWILHLAAIVGYPACAADPYLAVSTNVDGTRNVLTAMERGQKLIYASTGSTYGKVIGIATEETPIAPLTLYGRTKRDAEKLIRDSDVEHSILRFATVFGSAPRIRLDLLINDFVYQALHNRQIVLFEGHFRRTFLHSTDAAAVYPFTIKNFERMAGRIYNVGDSSMNFTKRQVALEIKKSIDFYLHEAEVGTDPDQRDYEVDYSRLKTLGFSAEVGLTEGIRELIKVLGVLHLPNLLRNA
ncbi:MAG: NAD(P)-dependent oxidoreductase [Isosphaeraceae bacterium]|nr:NAD(P)-dependent oxidoreductase [Isosphaeraceae bacterium]